MSGHGITNDETPLVAGIDAGGTSFKLGVAQIGGPIAYRAVVPTTAPVETMAEVARHFREAEAAAGRKLSAIAIASFGPVNIDPDSERYGTILSTPKPGWSGFRLRAALADEFDIPVIVDTDVNGALVAEIAEGAAKGTQSAAYVTVGTGIGVGLYVGEAFVARPFHPEFGHIRVRRHPADGGFSGSCPFHGDCLEGLASGAAVAARGLTPDTLPPDHPVWEAVADYLGQACLNVYLMFRLEKIVLGGGLMAAPGLIDRTRDSFTSHMNGYLPLDGGVDRLIRPAALGRDAGLRGALLLAQRSLRQG